MTILRDIRISFSKKILEEYTVIDKKYINKDAMIADMAKYIGMVSDMEVENIEAEGMTNNDEIKESILRGDSPRRLTFIFLDIIVPIKTDIEDVQDVINDSIQEKIEPLIEEFLVDYIFKRLEKRKLFVSQKIRLKKIPRWTADDFPC